MRPATPAPAPGSPQGPAPRSAHSLVLGVLGGIGSGKSAVARGLAGPRGRVIDADRIAREVLESAQARFAILARFGGLVFDAEGRVDRARLAARAFASEADRRALEDLTHPPIRARIRAELESARADGVPRIVLDVPLLLENDARHALVRECDELVYVDSEIASRDARAVRSRGWEPGEVARREAAQMPLQEKRARATRVIANRGTLADLEAAVEQLSAELGPRPPQPPPLGTTPRT